VTETNSSQNVASDIIPGKVLTSKSGTLAYLAPEVYAGGGYDVRADWWSLGVLFYECIYNKVGANLLIRILDLSPIPYQS
jgi:serine/threonine protein kinase